MIYYNQNNYADVPYPSPSAPNATIKSGGCGAACGAMIVSNLAGKTVDPVAMAQYAIKKGARVAGGTDMDILARNIRVDYGLSYKATNDENALLSHLKSGGMAVANVGGDRPGHVGVFSNSGHYIVAAGLTSAGKVVVLDPGYYVGKYNKPGRAGKVTVNDNACECDIAVLAKETENRSPAYWLFEAALPSVKVVLNGTILTNGIIINGHTYVPIAPVAVALGYQVNWDAVTNTVIVQPAAVKPPVTSKIKLLIINQIVDDITIIEGHAYMPIRDLVGALGHKVIGFDGESVTIQ